MFEKRHIGTKNQGHLLQAGMHGFCIPGLVWLFLFALIVSSQNVSGYNGVDGLKGLIEPALDSAFYARYPYVILIDEGDNIEISDDDFYRNAATVVFPVSKYTLPKDDQTIKELRDVVLPQIHRDSLRVVRVKLRGAASPEGSENFNRFLSEKRQLALYDFVRDYMQIPQGDSLMLETETESYSYLYRRMKQNADPDFEKVKPLFDEYMPTGQFTQLKRGLQTISGGRLWRRMLVTYYPSLRAACMLIVCQKKNARLNGLDVQDIPETPIEPVEPVQPIVPIEPITPIQPAEPIDSIIVRYPRREVLSVKTNMLLYGVYMPGGYDKWCPIPNVAIEYYPLRGHFTYGASFDFPWWQNYWGHKYFQVRNYQLEARYYLRKGDIELRPEGKGAAFKGLYFQAYGHATIFGICFDKDHGYMGEGGGAGLGIGYVMPLSKKGHWRLEFQLQAGLFFCKYDPYQFENLVNPDFHDNRYYYRWTLEPGLFKKRQYKTTWIGPTRIGITLSYDLLYRKARKKTDWTIHPKDTKPTRHYNPLVPYEKERKGAGND